MIKRLNLSRAEDTGSRLLIENEASEGPLFSPRRPLRKILVLIDAELMMDQAGADPNNPDLRILLSGMLDHSLVRLYRFSDDGPPATAKLIPSSFSATAYEGWAVMESETPEQGVWSVTYATEEGFSAAAVIGNAPEIAAKDSRSDAYRELDPQTAAKKRYRDALAAQVAVQAVNADIYVTERDYLHKAAWNVADGVTLCRPEEALAILSLYFRAQGEFLVASNFRFNRGLFYWVGTRELLPAAWRWFTACVQHSTRSNDEGLLLLAGSLLQRVDRALEARDAIHVALNQPQNNDLREDALGTLDVVLLLFMGAVDVAARVAHRILSIPMNERQAGWQDDGWLNRVSTRRPQLAAQVDTGTRGELALTILRLLRNSVHGAALQGMAFHRSGAAVETLVGLPAGQEKSVLTAMDSLGGRASWGVRQITPGRTYLDPGILVDRLFDEVLALLNGLLDETPVESLPHVSLTPEDVLPPTSSGPGGPSTDPFAPWIRQSIRWQLGL